MPSRDSSSESKPLPLEGIDLNLLLPLQALLEERHVSRAARSLNLSQPAMSRNLDRLRQILRDDLLLRTPKGYVLTRRAEELLPDLQRLVPLLRSFWQGAFSPATTTATVRFAMLDIVATQLLTRLARPLREQAPSLTLQITPWSEHPYEDIANGTVDLLLSPLVNPAPLKSKHLFDDRYTCIFWAGHSFRGECLTLEEYLWAKHISVDVPGGQQTLVDRPLLEAGYRRNIAVRVPYFHSALAALQGTDLILTTPSRMIKSSLISYGLRSAAAPSEIGAFARPLRYTIAWHPRSQADALHRWFRRFVVASCSTPLSESR